MYYLIIKDFLYMGLHKSGINTESV